MARAKYNVIHKYAVVGLTEEIGKFAFALELLLPDMFAHASKIFGEGCNIG